MYKVEGYVFESEEMARQAKKEADGIRYIRSQTRMQNPDAILKLYDKLLEQEIFETPVGLEYLHELQKYLESVPYLKSEDIRPIPVNAGYAQIAQAPRKTSAKRRTERENEEETYNPYRKRFHISMFFCIVFAVAIIGMFTITYLSGNNINIFNYQSQLVNKYEEWEKELEERETALEQREKLLQQYWNGE